VSPSTDDKIDENDNAVDESTDDSDDNDSAN
jgi:hypothetical protein